MNNIDLLREQITQLQYYLNLTWTIIALVITVISITGGILLKQWVNIETKKRLQEQAENIRDLEKENTLLNNKIDDNKVEEGTNANGRYAIFPKGTTVSAIKQEVAMVTSPDSYRFFNFIRPQALGAEKGEKIISIVTAVDDDSIPVDATITDEDENKLTIRIKPNKYKSEVLFSIISIGTII